MSSQVILWVGFNIFVVLMLVLDLRFFRREARVIGVREALLWSAFWITVSLLFNVLIYFVFDAHTALNFLTAYLVEKSLSVDNLFVFLLIFSYFGVPAAYQYKVLYWGVLGAIVMRFVFIMSGIALVEAFEWILYIFGAFLIYTAIRLALRREPRVDLSKNPLLRVVTRFVPVTSEYEGNRFFTRKDGALLATPLFIVVLVVETSDLVFAVDSIPAVIGITREPFIVYSSNILAILGLRALYFALAGIMRLFRFLSYGLMVVLFFIGAKMIAEVVYVVPVTISLGVVVGVLSISVVLSIIMKEGATETRRKDKWR
ncbi:MAG: TerC family protein [Dehalococcoidia bacterium]|nr:TerC family protein [Dehalococcoidia bacterium]